MTPTNARATAELARVTARVVTALRFAQCAFLCYFVAVWHSWYGDEPVRLLGPVAMVAWIATFLVLADRLGPTPRLVAADVVVAVVAVAGTSWVIPPASRGDAASWVGIAMLTAGVVVAVRAARAWFVVALVLLAAANLGGAWTHRPQVIVSTTLLVAIGVLIRLSYRRLSDVAFAADLWLEATFGRRTADAVADRRASEAREAERLIHDTVLNTLTGIGWGSLPDHSVVQAKCARSVATVEGLLADAEPTADGELATALRRTVALASELGMDVELIVQDRRGDRPSTPLRRRWSGAAKRAAFLAGIYARPVGDGDGGVRSVSGPATAPLPAEVVSALAAAVGEALTNVGRHAGTTRAQVVVELLNGRVVVAVADEGVGFDPARESASGAASAFDPGAAGRNTLGLRESVVGRVADVGGWVDIQSTPGAGTTVRLHWNAPDSAPLDQVDADSLQTDYDAAVRRAAGTIVAAMPVLGLVPMLGSLSFVDSRSLAVGVWAASAVLAVVLARLALRRGLRRGEAAGVVACGLALLVVSSFNVTLSQDVVRIMNWPLALVLPILTIFVVVSRPTREWIVACLVESAVIVAIGLGLAGAAPLELSRAASALYGLWTVQFLAAAFGPVLRASATTTALAATNDVNLASRQQAASIIRQDRLAQVRDLEERFLPLLRQVADGSVDPADQAVRRQCANRAGVLRRLLASASSAGGTSSGLAEIERPVEAAEARGVTVDVRLHGELWALPTSVRVRMAATVAEALQTVATGTVTLTVLCSAGEGTVYVTFPLPLGGPAWPGIGGWGQPSVLPLSPVRIVRDGDDGDGNDGDGNDGDGDDCDGDGVHVSTDVEDGIACVEMRWESSAA